MQAERFRSIAGRLDLQIEPVEGLTVVPAPNGTGKSSIADAVRAALEGSPARHDRALRAPVDRAVVDAELSWVYGQCCDVLRGRIAFVELQGPLIAAGKSPSPANGLPEVCSRAALFLMR